MLLKKTILYHNSSRQSDIKWSQVIEFCGTLKD